MTSAEKAAEQAAIQAEAQAAILMLEKEQAVANDGEVDPLDAYYADSGILQEAEAAAAEAEAKDAKDRETIAAGEEIDEGDRKMTYEQSREAQEAAGWHCYICKKYGHTKRDCPERKWDPTRVSARQAADLGLEMVCKHCGEAGHVIRDCTGKKLEDKQLNRKKQYEKKKMIRAAERLSLKAKVEKDLAIENKTKKEEFDQMVSTYGQPCQDQPVLEAEHEAIVQEMQKQSKDSNLQPTERKSRFSAPLVQQEQPEQGLQEQQEEEKPEQQDPEEEEEL